MDIGSKIKRLRLQKGLMQKELAEGLGVRPHYINRWENDVRPSAKYLAKLAEALDVDISELYSDSESTDISEKVFEGKEDNLTQILTRCVEQALANDPRLRLMDAKLEELVKRIKDLGKD